MPLIRSRYQRAMIAAEPMPEAASDAATPLPAQAPAETHRNKAIDGWRGVAAVCVVIVHAADYRFATMPGIALHYVQRLAEPIAEIGVQIFFCISGAIITSLLLREEQATRRVSIWAFYARRTCRILPPLFVYLAVVAVARQTGSIDLPISSLVGAASFTCNTGLAECAWFTAHTWSLAVEEQFYLAWPMLFVLLPARWRASFLVSVLVLLTAVEAIRVPVFHSNPTSFACIAIGALYAVSEPFRQALAKATNAWLWCAVVVLLLLNQFLGLQFIARIGLPLLIMYLVFAGNRLVYVRSFLESRPLQVLGAASYSLYLWQQLFLAKPEQYLLGTPSLFLLPLAVGLSVFAVERPFIRLGHGLSARLKARSQPATTPA